MSEKLTQKYDRLSKDLRDLCDQEHQRQLERIQENKVFERTFDRKRKALMKKIYKTGNELSDAVIKDDPVFLLSKEQFDQYQSKIPAVYPSWWLRSTIMNYKFQNQTVFPQWLYDVCCFETSGVRPALKIDPTEFLLPDVLGHIIHCGITWIKIDKGLYIAEVPIFFTQFDDNNHNFYYQSSVRKKLLDWYKERKDW